MLMAGFWIGIGLLGALTSRALHQWADRQLAERERQAFEQPPDEVTPLPCVIELRPVVPRQKPVATVTPAWRH